jgi:hypothetical protein
MLVRFGMVPLGMVLLGAVTLAHAQSQTCSGTPAWSTCDLAFDLEANENPDNLELRAEFRSSRRTYLMPAFRDAGRHFIIRFAPTEAGEWTYRLTSNLTRLNGQAGTFTANSSDSPGFVKANNAHHFLTENGKPHLWMASAIEGFTKIPRADFDRAVEQRTAEKFTHLRVTIDSDADLREAADRVRAINAHGLTADLALAALPEDALARRKYVSDIAARFAAMNITWMGVATFEKIRNARATLKDAGNLLQRLDPYDHPRTSMAEGSSAALAPDQWTNFRSYGMVDPNVGAVEHQFYLSPAVNTAIHSQKDLWNATMNGQFPDSGEGSYMTAWFNLMSGNRYWELEPYFDLDGGRALALDGVDYIVYVEKPGPVEVSVKNHGYDVAWIDPATGERTKAKGYKGEHFVGEPPSKAHDWVLQISREGKKESMLKSYKFDSRGDEDSEAAPIQLQEIQTDPAKIPFDVAAPPEGDLSLKAQTPFVLKVKRDTRATRSLLVEWTAEVTADGEGYRVAGVGRDGTLKVPPAIAHSLPASVILHVSILNANGKAYTIDKVYRLIQ